MTIIEFTDDKNPDKKAVITITDDSAEIEFSPEVEAGDPADYVNWAAWFMQQLTT